jgi:hypothetical protein
MFFTPNVASLSEYQKFYPDDHSTVDLIGIDYYPKSTSGNSFVDVMKPFHDAYTSASGPHFAIGEIGLGVAADMSSRLAWFKDMTSAETKSAMPHYVAVSWFNYVSIPVVLSSSSLSDFQTDLAAFENSTRTTTLTRSPVTLAITLPSNTSLKSIIRIIKIFSNSQNISFSSILIGHHLSLFSPSSTPGHSTDLSLPLSFAFDWHQIQTTGKHIQRLSFSLPSLFGHHLHSFLGFLFRVYRSFLRSLPTFITTHVSTTHSFVHL